jgi:hypothetical protein
MLTMSVAQSFALHVPRASVPERRPLTEADAVDIWIALWLRIRRRDLISRYGCDPRRLYEIWEEARFPGARAQAEELFAARYPFLSLSAASISGASRAGSIRTSSRSSNSPWNVVRAARFLP